MRGRGACVAGGMCGRGHAWQGGMRGRGACVAGGMCERGHGGGHVWQGACMEGGYAWQGGMHGRYYEIWSMSGRYASYWNAFLLVHKREMKHVTKILLTPNV